MVCYYENWSQYQKGAAKMMPTEIPTDLCTHINYAFAKVSESTFQLEKFEWNDYSEYCGCVLYFMNTYKKATEIRGNVFIYLHDFIPHCTTDTNYYFLITNISIDVHLFLEVIPIHNTDACIGSD